MLVLATIAAACGGDGDDSPDADGTPTQTPSFLPESFTIEEALAELDDIIDLVQNPDPSVVEATNVGQFELNRRITEVVEGTPEVPGLNEVRSQLAAEDRILTGEYLHNNLVETLAAPFSRSDTDSISPGEIQEIDPRGIFAELGSSFEVSSIFRDAVVRVIELWYRI
ncbi:MAG: hypothetical protein ACE5FA_05485 [Dehalococcoidia bacterium]